MEPLWPAGSESLYSPGPAPRAVMKIAVDQIEESPKSLSYEEGIEELNARLGSGTDDYRFERPIGVDLEYYRAGLDIYFGGSLRAPVRGTCARCLEDYGFALETPLSVVLTPRAAAVDDEGEVRADDLGLSFYDGDEIDVTALVHEQAMLALPTRPLCNEACHGLCPHCGTNLNPGPCGCAATTTGSPFAALLQRARQG